MWFGRKYVAIVGAYSAGSLLAREFRRRGYRSVHVQPQDPMQWINKLDWRPQDFVENVLHRGDLDETCRRVARYRPKIVLNGSEEGVELADRICERLGYPGNGTALVDARRDKFLMAEALERAGVRNIRHFRSGDLAELTSWIAKNLTYPVVVKPLDAAGSDLVTLCRDADAVRVAFEAIVGRINRMGTLSHEVLAQAYTPGDEYVLNTVSHDGRHYLTDIWLSAKTAGNGRDFLYDYLDLLEPRGERQDALFAYLCRSLDALGVKWGPSHCELKWGPDGPVLIEIGARIGGGAGHGLNLECAGVSQPLATCDVYSDPGALAKLDGPGRSLRRHARLVCLIARSCGIVRAIPGEAKVKRLPSFFRFGTSPRPGDPIHVTESLYTCPGDVSLVHDDPEVIELDTRRVREIEAEGFYEIDETGTVPPVTFVSRSA